MCTVVVATWVLISKFSELTGYTPNAVRAKIKRGVWLRSIHWLKAPDGRILVNLPATQAWAQGKAG